MQLLKAENAQLRGAMAAMQQRVADLELGRQRPLGESCTLRAVRASVRALSSSWRHSRVRECTLCTDASVNTQAAMEACSSHSAVVKRPSM